jgi:hypothetical protein
MKNAVQSAIAVLMLCAALNASPVDMMIGTRAYGFGGAYVAIAKDPTAAYWNPACLSQVKTLQLENSNWIFQDVDGINVNFLAFTVPIKYVGTIGGSWLLNHASLEYGESDVGGNVTIKSHSSNEHRFSLSAGRALWDKLLIFEQTSLGFSLNRHTYTTDGDRNGAGLGFDVGFYTGLPLGFSLGFCAHALGTDIMGEKIDPEIRFGVGWSRLFNDMHRVTAALDGDVKKNRDYKDEDVLEAAENNMKFFGGLEYGIVLNDWEIAIRGGGNGSLYSTLGSVGFAAGLGLKFMGYAVQYAFRGESDRDVTLGYQHRISLVVDFSNLGFASIKTGAEEETAAERDDDMLQIEEPAEEAEMPEVEPVEEDAPEIELDSDEETPETDLDSDEEESPELDLDSDFEF